MPFSPSLLPAFFFSPQEKNIFIFIEYILFHYNKQDVIHQLKKWICKENI